MTFRLNTIESPGVTHFRANFGPLLEDLQLGKSAYHRDGIFGAGCRRLVPFSECYAIVAAVRWQFA